MKKILSFVLVLVVLAVAWYMWDKSNNNSPTNQTTDSEQTYTSSQNGYEFTYPDSWAAVREIPASSSDYLPNSRSFVAIYPTSFPASDYDARVDVYNTPLATVKLNNPFLKGKDSTTVSINGITWTKVGTDNYLTEKNGKTYNVSGKSQITERVLAGFEIK